MKRKLRIGIFFGGRSAEHEVSIVSAKNVAAALDVKKYDLALVGIDKMGQWYLHRSPRCFARLSKNPLIPNHRGCDRVTLVLGKKTGELFNLTRRRSSGAMDVAFPVLHGTYGEDGTVQGLLKIARVPFVGPSVLGSAVCMDKEVSKRLLELAGIAVAPYLTVHKHDHARLTFEKIKRQLGIPFFIKPANLGSSVGVHKVRTKKEFASALRDAFRYDTKVLVERAILGREIECAVLGNEHLLASIPGEIVPRHEFYSYEAKYLDKHGADLIIPASLSRSMVHRIQMTARKVCETLSCEGMARVDFFLKRNGALVVNEVNTIPGFTAISMYPKLWQASGLSYQRLLDTLITLALARFRRDEQLNTVRTKSG